MPPFLPRKRSSPPPPPRQPRSKKPRLADILDADAAETFDLSATKTFSVKSGSNSGSSLSDVDSDQFEDVVTDVNGAHEKDESGENEDSDDDQIEWEDAAPASEKKQPQREALADGPIQITFRKEDDEIDYSSLRSTVKKGPTRREKHVRINTHKLHVQFLLWHNAIRNSWVNDKKVQNILVQQLPQQILQEIEKWKRASGLVKDDPKVSLSKAKDSRRRSKKGKHTRNQRDWGNPSSLLEAGKPDMSHGDPLISLMKVLAAYWKKRFAITAPGLRKRGYSTKQQLKRDILSYRTDPHDPEKHGEKVIDLESYRRLAEKSEGSRDIGAQLFTALVRGIGIEARLVASLQPSGYGWTKTEQMLPKKFTKDAGSMDIDECCTSEHEKGLKTRITPNKKQTPRDKSAKKKTIINLDPEDDDQNLPSDTDDDSVIDVTISMPKQKQARYDRDLAYPIYWTEVISPVTCKVLPVSPLCLDNPVASASEALSSFEPRGAKAEKTHQIIAYVIAHSSDGTAKDVTVRYLRKNIWPGKTKGYRIPLEKVPIYDKTGRIKKYGEYDWFKHVMSSYGRSTHMRTATDDIEDSTDLVPAQLEAAGNTGIDTLQSLKASQDFVLERFLRREEALKPGAAPDRMFVAGKGDNAKEEPVYRRADVERCLTAESWHKEGRRPNLGETPMKMVPVRAVTLTRKREAEEHERTTGEKQLQGLYSWDQTEWIIPEPIKDGVIPKNSYGNMDCFVPSMVPKGAVHIPLKGTVRICKRLEIDFAEAVTGFEFGNKRAVPVCTGVIVAKEHEKAVREAWKAYNEEQRQKEEAKLEKLVLDTWKKFVIGLRIRERVAAQYGDQLTIDDPATGMYKEHPINIDEDEDLGSTPAATAEPGGFWPEDIDADEMGGGFLMPHEDDISDTGELVMEDDGTELPRDKKLSSTYYPTPTSLTTKNEEEMYNSDSQSEAVHIPRAPHILPSYGLSRRSSAEKSRSTQNARSLSKREVMVKTSQEKTLTVNDSAGSSDEVHAPVASFDDAGITNDRDDEDNSDDSEEQYTPRSTKRARQASMKGKNEHNGSRTPASNKRAGARLKKSNKQVADVKKNENVASRAQTPRRKTRTALTSPYFESSE